MFAIYLYTADPAVVNPEKIDAILALVDFSGEVKVSRTVGPVNWSAWNAQELAAAKRGELTVKDIARESYASTAGISALSRQGSVLTVSYASAKSTRLGELARALHRDVPVEAKGFMMSAVRFRFGPVDIVAWGKDAAGQPSVRLLDVAQFMFFISSDWFPGDQDVFREGVPEVQEFSRLRSELEQITGPLQLHVSR